MSDTTKKYIKEDIAVIWKPALCIHSARCFRGLPGVFDPRRRPWINLNEASLQEITHQVGDCPSGALSIEKVKESDDSSLNQTDESETVKIEATKKGPLIVTGDCTVVDENGLSTLKQGRVALCRCGGSSNKPYCDGTHRKNNVL